jgi:hypothetical protein
VDREVKIQAGFGRRALPTRCGAAAADSSSFSRPREPRLRYGSSTFAYSSSSLGQQHREEAGNQGRQNGHGRLEVLSCWHPTRSNRASRSRPEYQSAPGWASRGMGHWEAIRR